MSQYGDLRREVVDTGNRVLLKVPKNLLIIKPFTNFKYLL